MSALCEGFVTTMPYNAFKCIVIIQGRWEDTLMNMDSFDRGTDAASAVVETQALAQQGLTREEIAALLRLQEWYQHGEVIASTSSAISSSSSFSSGIQANRVRSFAKD